MKILIIPKSSYKECFGYKIDQDMFEWGEKLIATSDSPA